MKPMTKTQKIVLWSLAAIIVAGLGFYLRYKEEEEQEKQIRENYRKEISRFSQVLQEASDEERFLMLRYAMYQHYVPTLDIDPYGYIFCGVGRWHRTILIFNSLSERKDLLSKIYPDMDKLEKYVHSGAYSAIDSTIMKDVDQNLAKDSLLYDSIYRRKDKDKLEEKYFGTPLMKRG